MAFAPWIVHPQVINGRCLRCRQVIPPQAIVGDCQAYWHPGIGWMAHSPTGNSEFCKERHG